MRIISYIFVLFIFSTIGYSIEIPNSAIVIDESGKGNTWRQNLEIPMPFPSAKNSFEAKLLSQGYSKKHEDVIQKKNMSVISLWIKGQSRIILMMWRIGNCKTGISWGFEK